MNDATVTTVTGHRSPGMYSFYSYGNRESEIWAIAGQCLGRRILERL